MEDWCAPKACEGEFLLNAIKDFILYEEDATQESCRQLKILENIKDYLRPTANGG